MKTNNPALTDKEKIAKASADFAGNYSGLAGMLARLLIFQRFAKVELRLYAPENIEAFQDKCLDHKEYNNDRFYLWYYKDQLETD